MKRILDINSFIKEAEDVFIESIRTDNDKIKIKHKKNNHPITNWIVSSVDSIIKKNQNKVHKKINLRTNKKLTKQEVYTLKKSSLDFISNELFSIKNKDFFSNNFIIKITENNKPKDFPIKLKKEEILYIYFNFNPLSLIKLSKNSSILDPISGKRYLIEEYYQNNIREDFIAKLNKGYISLEFPMFFGYILLSTTK